MGQRIDPADLVGAAEIARRLRLKRPNLVHTWNTRKQDGFPKPVAQLDRAYVWSWKQVRDWAKKTGRL